jgi:hypothetical protein
MKIAVFRRFGTLYQFHLQRLDVRYEVFHTSHTSHPAFEDGTDRVFRNVGIQQSDAGETPKRIHTRFKTRRKFEIKNVVNKYFSINSRTFLHTLYDDGRCPVVHIHRKANSRSPGQKCPYFLCNPRVRQRVHKKSRLRRTSFLQNSL